MTVVEGSVQRCLAKLLESDESVLARVEVTRIAEFREAIVAILQALVRLDEQATRSEALVGEVHAIMKNQQPQRDWYGVPELAALLGKAEFTVREWCRLGRVNASKRPCGRGNSQEWIVSHDEVTRIQNEGLLRS